MILSFELSMPCVNSWNGRWSGDSDYYGQTRYFTNTKKNKELVPKILENSYYNYNFGDGWVVGITVKQINSKEATKIQKKIKGFCGYDWMIDSIIKEQKIKYKEQ